MTMVDRTCWCGKVFQAKSADVKRGWGNACSKAHAAHAREKKLDRFGFQRGESGTFHSRRSELRSADRSEADHRVSMDAIEDGWDGHKNAL